MKKKNPQDATLRNVKAAKKRENSILKRLKRLEAAIVELGYAVFGDNG